MKNYQIGEIFYLDDEYSARAQFCNENNLIIVEIEPDELGRRFQIQEMPEPTEEEVLNNLRARREYECFSIVNRGVLWYNTLTEVQRLELDTWYKAWLDITEAYQPGIDIETIIPVRPDWLV